MALLFRANISAVNFVVRVNVNINTVTGELSPGPETPATSASVNSSIPFIHHAVDVCEK